MCGADSKRRIGSEEVLSTDPSGTYEVIKNVYIVPNPFLIFGPYSALP